MADELNYIHYYEVNNTNSQGSKKFLQYKQNQEIVLIPTNFLKINIIESKIEKKNSNCEC